MDLDIDSHAGIAFHVVYTVTAEMVQQGQMMNYTCKETQNFSVKNALKPDLKPVPEVTLGLVNS